MQQKGLNASHFSTFEEMAPNQPGRLVQFLVGKARREECLSESYNESLAKTSDLNPLAANLSSFGGHPVQMKIGSIDGVKVPFLW